MNSYETFCGRSERKPEEFIREKILPDLYPRVPNRGGDAGNDSGDGVGGVLETK